MKILNVIWCTEYGFVTIDNGYEIKTYMGNTGFMPEKEAIDNIVKFGRKISREQLEKILSFYKDN